MTQPDQPTPSRFDANWPRRFSGAWWAGTTMLAVAAFIDAAALTLAMHLQPLAPFVGTVGIVLAYVAGAIRSGGLER